MATNFTDYQDPFDLLLTLNNASMQRIYGNPFARGNRSDMNMGFSGSPSSQVGATSYARDRLAVNAPSRQFDRSVGTPSNPQKSSVPTFKINRSVSQPIDSPDYGNQEYKRMGSLTKTLFKIGAEATGTIQGLRKTARETAAQEQIKNQFKPRLDEVNTELEATQAQIDKQKLLINVGKGLLDRRTTQRQQQGQQMQSQNRSTFNTIAQNIPEVATSVLSKTPGLQPYGMLDATRGERVNKAMESLFSNQPGTPPPPPASKGIPSMAVDWSASTIPAGPTEPTTMYQKDKNSATLSTPKTNKGTKGTKGTKPQTKQTKKGK